MSLRYEQYRALISTRKFLTELMLGNGHTKDDRERARCCLRHFPILLRNGEPLFSNDEFECPEYKDDDLYW